MWTDKKIVVIAALIQTVVYSLFFLLNAFLASTPYHALNIAFIYVASLIVSLLITMWCFAVLSQSPLRRLNEQVEKLAAGDYATEIESRRLPGEFNNIQMALDQLRKRLLSLTLDSKFVDDVMKSMVDSLIIVSPDGLIQTVNPATLSMLGYEKKEMIGAHFSVIIDSLGILSESSQGSIETTYRRKDGKCTPVLLSSTLIKDQQGDTTGILLIALDISESKETKIKLKETEEKLQSTSQALGMTEVTTGILHNVGNVLNSVNVSTRLITDSLKSLRVAGVTKAADLLERILQEDTDNFEDKSSQLAAYLRKIGEQIEFVQAMIQKETVNLSKHIEHIKNIVSTQQSYATSMGIQEEVSLTDVVDDVLTLNENAFYRNKVDVVKDYTDDLPRVNIDKHKLLQILLNLVSNAKFAMNQLPVGKRKLDVRVKRQGSDCAIIEFEDNGVGIELENLNRIFDYAFSTRVDGHGFGLHASRLNAKELGGDISAFSEGSGKGARFRLVLPLNTTKKKG